MDKKFGKFLEKKNDKNDFYGSELWGSELFTLDFRVVKVNEIKSTLTYELGIKNDICTGLIN